MKKHFRVVSVIALSLVIVLGLVSIRSTTIAQTETTPEENVANVTNFYEEFSAGNVDVFLDLYADSITRHTYGGLSQVVSAQPLHQAFEMVKGLIPDLSAEIHNIYASGELVVAEVTWTGTHTAATFLDMPATDRAFTLHSLNVRRFENGKVVEDWDVLDDLVFLQSIGYLPSVDEIRANGPIDD
jgi:steroid delta-isomerase-like uncharacterized protein